MKEELSILFLDISKNPQTDTVCMPSSEVGKIQKSNPILLNQSNPYKLQSKSRSNQPVMNQIQSNPNPQIQSI